MGIVKMWSRRDCTRAMSRGEEEPPHSS